MRGACVCDVGDVKGGGRRGKRKSLLQATHARWRDLYSGVPWSPPNQVTVAAPHLSACVYTSLTYSPLPTSKHTQHTQHRDFDASKEEWCWARDAPPSQKAGGGDAAKKLKKKVGAESVMQCCCTGGMLMLRSLSDRPTVEQLLWAG